MDTYATHDANGRSLIYPGPDGKTAYYEGRPLGIYGDSRYMAGRLTVSRKGIENAVYAALVSGVPATIDDLAPAIWQELRAKASLAGIR